MYKSVCSLSLVGLLLLGTMPTPLQATCGGGGGGGLGGISGSGSGPSEARVYRVPWQISGSGNAAVTDGLVLYWFPTSPEEAQASALVTSRPLTLWAAQCVGMVLVPSQDTALRSRHQIPGTTEAAVLAAADGAELGRELADDKGLRVRSVEKLVGDELDRREALLKASLKEAKTRQKKGDDAGAVELYREVFAQRCLFPSVAKKAVKALEQLGQPVPEAEARALDRPSPDRRASTTRAIQHELGLGLEAESVLDLAAAQRHYQQARRLDPADPVPLRYLGELYRHHTGDWTAARRVFEQILAMPADPLSRAVALHGLGKMTIHGGDSSGGLTRFEESLDAYPLALTYRNLAVFWSSEGEAEKAFGYSQKALELDPDDAYNQIFAATYLVGLGRPEEAAEVVARHGEMLEASYNLAAIQALLGHREEALKLLHRHFFEYEQNDLVRAKEMQEARDDIVFAGLHADPEFVHLTRLADGLGGSLGSAGSTGGE